MKNLAEAIIFTTITTLCAVLMFTGLHHETVIISISWGRALEEVAEFWKIFFTGFFFTYLLLEGVGKEMSKK